MNKVAIIAMLVFTTANGSEPNWKEADWSRAECDSLGGITEYVLPNKTRVDCLTEDYAIEHDFSRKWYECITQGMYYAMWTGRVAACSLIIKKESDMKYFHRAEKLINHYNLPVKLWRTKENNSTVAQ